MEEFINQKATEYADSKLDKDCPYSKNVQRKERQFDWADIADAFEAGAKWMAKLPPYNAVLSPPTFKPTFDEKKIRELLESSEMHSRFSIKEYLEQTLYKLYFEQGSVSIEDIMRKNH